MDTELRELAEKAQRALDEVLPIVTALVKACCGHDGQAVFAVAQPFIDQHGPAGSFAVASALAGAFATFSGLDHVNDGVPGGTHVLARIEFTDHLPVFPEPGLSGRITTAARFVERYLGDRDDLSYLAITRSEIDPIALIKGLCELVAAASARHRQRSN